MSRRSLLAPAVLGLLTSLAAAVVLFGGVFGGRDAGLADNGDGPRYTCQLGLVAERFIQHESAWFTFEPVPAGQPSCLDDPVARAPSSWVLLAGPFVQLVQLVDGPGFDLRWFGAATCVVLGLLAALFVLSWRTSRLRAVALTVPLLLVALDVTFLGYANAPYVEIGGFLLVLLFAALLVRATGRDRPLGRDLLLLGICGAVLVALKAATVSLAAVVGLVLLVLTVQAVRRARARAVVATVAAAVVAFGAVGGAALAELRLQGTGYWQTNQYNLLFATVLENSSDPARTLTDLGLDPALAPFADTQIWDPDNALAQPGYPQAQREFSRLDYVRHVVTHREQWQPLVERATLEITQPRVTRQADVYQPEATDSVTVHPDGLASRALHLLQPLGAWGVVGSWVLGLAVGLAAFFRTSRPVVRQWAAFLVLVAAIAPVQMVTALVGDGYGEIRKHLVFSAYASGLELALLAGGVLALAVQPVVRGRERVGV
ncbi:glycan biosynthesis hexose transferase WsfD [Kineococcus sp. SYSU DK003]|uniref:glycan biosynthesis hexose transferase WsfD n=1 Tax=Kineococcus sp. SYSU DK003 TaxID=3383124 RepID=UPI003D7DA89C